MLVELDRLVVLLSDRAVEAYDKLEEIIISQRNYQTPPSDYAPNFYDKTNTSGIEKKISQQNQLIIKNESVLPETRKILALQVELVRLRASADLIYRSMKNVKIHASSLSIHYQNMRNINGLIDDVNSLRHGLKATISTINYNINIQSGADSKLKKIEGIDIEKTEGAISQVAAYDAFDRTRELLRSEVINLSEVAKKHLNDINNLKENAADIERGVLAQVNGLCRVGATTDEGNRERKRSKRPPPQRPRPLADRSRKSHTLAPFLEFCSGWKLQPEARTGSTEAARVTCTEQRPFGLRDEN